jgi:FdhE protein
VPTPPSQGRSAWSKRLDRAEELAERNPWASEVLAFYSRILQFQRDLYHGSPANPATTRQEGLRSSLNLDGAARSFSDLLAVIRKSGPPKLAEEAGRLQGSSAVQVRGMLEQWLAATDPPDDGSAFFARVLLQPQAEQLARAGGFMREQVAGNKCPYCQSDPQLAVIRPEGDGGKRLLLCSLCQSEWEFHRILCPACGEVHNEKLPRYSAEGISAVRVEACDVCKSYLKSVDMTVDGLAVPVVDEVATAPLDLWAAEQGYRKIHLNLMGF